MLAKVKKVSGRIGIFCLVIYCSISNEVSEVVGIFGTALNLGETEPAMRVILNRWADSSIGQKVKNESIIVQAYATVS